MAKLHSPFFEVKKEVTNECNTKTSKKDGPETELRATKVITTQTKQLQMM